MLLKHSNALYKCITCHPLMYNHKSAPLPVKLSTEWLKIRLEKDSFKINVLINANLKIKIKNEQMFEC